ncbi:unnamed protein product, partial [marine sediment metagenome]
SKKEEVKPREVVFGARLPLIRINSSAGEANQAALEIAVDGVNEYFSDIGSKTKVKLIVEDTKTDLMIALEKINSLLAVNREQLDRLNSYLDSRKNKRKRPSSNSE